MSDPYLGLEESAPKWLLPLLEQSRQIITSGNHGDLPKWQEALQSLPEAPAYFGGNKAAPVHGRETANPAVLQEKLQVLHPWRKGPLEIAGIKIDTEWRSDWKWDRIAPYLDLQGHSILDIGCGNGYYGWRMLGLGAECVIGIDPTLIYVMQWLACRHFSGEQANYVLPLGIEDLPTEAGGFDTVFSMGVLYHRRDPVVHLQRMAALLKPGGQLLLETLVIEGEEQEVLVPESRYARMRNVWAIPGVDQLSQWLRDAGYESIETLDVSKTSTEEQRSTEWMRFESLAESLDPENSKLTIEGYPAPIRAALLAKTH